MTGWRGSALRSVRVGIGLASRWRLRRGRRPVCGYIGWLGRGNLGDEAAFMGLKRLRSDIHWVPVVRVGYGLRLACALGLDGPAFHRSVALGGGTLINPGGYIPWVRTLLELGQTMWCCGTGVGSVGWYQDPEGDLAAWSGLLGRFKGVAVRGPQSKNALEAIGVTHAEVCGDLALALVREEAVPPVRPPVLALNASVPKRADDPVDAQNLMNTLVRVTRCWQRRGGRILPLAMDEEDVPPLKRICRSTGIDPGRVVYSLDPDAAIEALSGCTALVGVRLHSAVLACCAGVPPVLLGYRPKCLDFMLSMGLPESNIDLLKSVAESIEDRIESLIFRPPVERTDLLARAGQWAAVQRGFVDRMVGPHVHGRDHGDNESPS